MLSRAHGVLTRSTTASLRTMCFLNSTAMIKSSALSTKTPQGQSSTTTPDDRFSSPENTPTIKRHKTQAELDSELIAKIKGAYGDRDEGGEAGIEYEDGKAVAMKRGVKANMFRYI
ncbi:Hypothetical protein D9617_23g006310 [Elsinoe fawcettii]|nr:Hypothetical protein D9617_23g006310 [Elsinoe fawcettii]